MTIEQTRQLGIEFERRVQAIMPTEEFLNKLDTDTIYSYLNEYQSIYVHNIYRTLDKLEPDTTLTAHVESILLSMMTSVTLNEADAIENNNKELEWNDIINDCGRSYTWKLPANYYMYIRSVSNVTKTYSFASSSTNNITVLPNVYIKQTDIWKVIETPHNSLRILRNPAIVLSQYTKDTYWKRSATITVIFDKYTDIKGVKVIYYKQPQRFDLMTSTPCELPIDAFDDLVSGAVQLYLSYATAQNRKKEDPDNRDNSNEQLNTEQS